MKKIKRDIKSKKEKAWALFEILLAISLTITTAYFIDEASKDINISQKINHFTRADAIAISVLALIGKLIFSEKGIVSALSSSDLQQGSYTCPVSKNGSICQEYPSSECESKCDSSYSPCIPAPRSQTSECKLGTCFNPSDGTCSTSSPKKACESNEGQWFDDIFGNVKQCKKGCCFIGSETGFYTDRQCNYTSALLGTDKIFKPEIKDELSCLIKGKTQEEGACVFSSEFEKTCKFTTKADCLKLRGTFSSGFLCSSIPGVDCKGMQAAGCVSGKDEIYWFDSCGNRENIYEGSTPLQKEHSFNSGKILLKNQSCSLGTSSNPFANRGSCGNCNYLLGSKCGLNTETEYLNEKKLGVVCRDLTCIDEKGKLRQNGESWCVYESSIGTDTGAGGFLRSTDAPGSRHFRKVCIDGEITTEPCADYRNEICVESKTTQDSGQSFSSSACRINRWQQCINYNFDIQTERNPTGAIAVDQLAEVCNKNPDCFIKHVEIGSNFKFDVCSPKYPEGFDLRNTNSARSAASFCSIATSMKCKEIWIADEGGDFNCEVNCECHSQAFVEQMNDFCTSLGDCGTKVNYEGDLTINHKITVQGDAMGGIPSLSQSYLDAMKKYSTPIPGKVADSGKLSDFFGSLGIPDNLGFADSPTDPSDLGMTGMIVGAGGMALAYAGSQGLIVGAYGAMCATSCSLAFASGLSAAAGALAGAAIAVAAISMLIKFTGIGPGIGEEGTYALLAAGAVAGAIIGAAVAGFGATAGTASAAFMAVAIPIAWVVIVAIVIFIIIEWLLGAGEIKEVTYTFNCQPWQPPLGGAKCSECGKNGLPCGKYSCQSLGQTCEFLNEGTDKEVCVDNDPNDVTAPIIKPMTSVLLPGFSISDESDLGFRIKSNESDGCVKTYQRIDIGIETFKSNGKEEPSQCRVSSNHTSSFDFMQYDFDGTNLFLPNHVQTISIPSLDSLGIPGYDPTRQTDYNLYVRCMDKNGNKNNKEYAINFCVKPGDDLTAPMINAKIPGIDWVRFDQTDVNASVYTDEPAECKWDLSDVEYDSMMNTFECKNKLRNQEFLGWRCNTNLPITASNKTIFYVRCKDQPWLTESPDGISPSIINVDAGFNADGTEIIKTITASATKHRNVMTESYKFILGRTESDLKIDSITPNNQTITSGVSPVSVKVNVKTSGGIDGKSNCRYAVRADSYLPLSGDTFVPPNVRDHNVILSLLSGYHLLYVKCTDLAGNEVDGHSTFTVEIDTDPPIVTRVYRQGDQINLITDEPAECSYQSSIALNPDVCQSDFSDATLMSGSDLSHSAPFNVNSIYYIKCKDSNGNENSGCGIIAKGADLKLSENNQLGGIYVYGKA